MGSTNAPLSLPYPVAADPPDGPGSFYALATKIQQTLGHTTNGPQTAPGSLNSLLDNSSYVQYQRSGYTVTLTGYINAGTAIAGGATSVLIGNALLYGPERPATGLNFPVVSGNGPFCARGVLDTSSNMNIYGQSGTVPHFDSMSLFYFVFSYVVSIP